MKRVNVIDSKEYTPEKVVRLICDCGSNNPQYIRIGSSLEKYCPKCEKTLFFCFETIGTNGMPNMDFNNQVYKLEDVEA